MTNGTIEATGYDGRAIANFLLDCSDMSSRPVTHLWLQKAIFISHGWSLAILDRPLLKDPVEAWQYGPVVRSVYRSFSEFGDDKLIGVRAQKLDMSTGEFTEIENTFDSEESQLMNQVFQSHKKYKGTDLVHITHKIGSPWRQVWDEAKTKANPGMRIPNQKIKEYYQNTTDGFIKI